MKKVWIVNHSALPPKLGGLNRHYYFSKYLSEINYDIKIITASAIHNTDINIIGKDEPVKIKEKEFDGVKFTYLKTSGYKGNGVSRVINLIQFPWRLLRSYRRFEKPDVIYASSPSPFAAYAAIRIAKRLKVPVILEVRDLWPESIVVYGRFSKGNPVIWLMYRMEKWMYRKADLLIFTFPGGADYIRDKKWDRAINISKVYNINNGVDLEEYQKCLSIPFPDSDLDDPAAFKAVYAGSVRKSYKLGNLLDAARIVAKTNPDIRFLIWGDGNEREDLMERCTKESINNVSFKGRIERDKIPSVLSKANVNIAHVNPLGVNLARYGCSQNKMFDYLASKKPMVSNYRFNYDIIEQYNCGVIAESLTPESLAKAIIAVHDMSKDEYEQMCNNSSRAANDYDYKLLSKKLDVLIQKAINRAD